MKLREYPRISVVTPSFNQGLYLEETIRSVLHQGYPNLEYFIMDGGSTDNSLAIIKKYEHWLTYWESQPDRGQSQAINRGWQRSTGSIIAWLNSDDLYFPNTLFKIAELWNENNRYGFISGITERIDHNGNPTGKTFGSEFDLEKSLMTSINPVAQQSTFISRTALETVGFLDESLHMSMDWDLWIRIADKYPTMFIPHKWSKFREWNETKTSTKLDQIGLEHIKIVKKYYANSMNTDVTSKRNISLSSAYSWSAVYNFRQANIFRFYLNVFLSVVYNPKNDNPELVKALKKTSPILSRIFSRLHWNYSK